jgi:diguanylate cyclase (GGDEF)-like protein
MKYMSMKMIETLEKQGKPFWIVAGFVLLCVVGILDYLTGHELSFSLFYLLPIGVFAWFVSNRLGVITAFISAGIWLAADVLDGASYSRPGIYFWNAAIRLAFFLLMVFFLKVGKALERERVFARTDYVTGAVNSRFFHALLQREIDRSVRYRYPFTIAYIDIDNFKTINDRFGHAIGDRVLSAVVNSMQRNLRKTDIVARVGGDEFAVLLPEVGADAAQVVISKLHTGLLEELQENDWQVTFSIGVVTFIYAAPQADEVINIADRAMYSVKNNGKNNVSYTVQTGQQLLAPDAVHT